MEQETNPESHLNTSTETMADPTSPSPYSENKKFEPKVPVELNAPKTDEITLDELSKNDGKATPPQPK